MLNHKVSVCPEFPHRDEQYRTIQKNKYICFNAAVSWDGSLWNIRDHTTFDSSLCFTVSHGQIMRKWTRCTLYGDHEAKRDTTNHRGSEAAETPAFTAEELSLVVAAVT